MTAMRLRVTGREERDGRISHADYAVVARFWTERGADAPPRAILPGLGVILERDGQAAACGFLYLDATGSGLGWLAWLATDPELPRMAAGRALRHVLIFLEGEARRLGYWAVQATLGGRSFVSLMKSRGYVPGDTGLTHLYLKLTE